MGKSGKKCPKWGVFGHFRRVFVSHETQPPRRIVPRETYIFAPFFTLLGVFHMKRRFYYIFANFNELLVSCETSVLCGFVAFHRQIWRLSGLFSSKMACETIYPPWFCHKRVLFLSFIAYICRLCRRICTLDWLKRVVCERVCCKKWQQKSGWILSFVFLLFENEILWWLSHLFQR